MLFQETTISELPLMAFPTDLNAATVHDLEAGLPSMMSCAGRLGEAHVPLRRASGDKQDAVGAGQRHHMTGAQVLSRAHGKWQ